MIYSILNEKTEKEVQISVYFDQWFKSLTNQEWDTKKSIKLLQKLINVIIR